MDEELTILGSFVFGALIASLIWIMMGLDDELTHVCDYLGGEVSANVCIKDDTVILRDGDLK